MTRGPSISFIDVFALMLVVLFLLPMKPDVSRDDDSRAGTIVIEAHWPDGTRTDVDLWVQAAGDAPVGYSRLRGSNISLFRDDLGIDNSVPWRYEIAASRSIPDGEYIVNLHLYRNESGLPSIPVGVVAWYRNDTGKTKHIIIRTEAVLTVVGEEITVVRFRMAAGYIVPGSIHYTPKRLRAVGGGAGP